MEKNNSEIWIKVLQFSFNRMHLEMSSAKWVISIRPQCVNGLNSCGDDYSLEFLKASGPFYWHGLTLIPAKISDYFHDKSGMK